jgi:hypothetical protein
MHWLKECGVYLKQCPGFDYDDTEMLITTRYYAENEQGDLKNAPWSPRYEDQVREFPASYTPKVISDALAAWRGQ